MIPRPIPHLKVIYEDNNGWMLNHSLGKIGKNGILFYDSVVFVRIYNLVPR